MTVAALTGHRGLRRGAAAAVGAATAQLVYRATTRRAAAASWQRTNHRGEPVTLLEGPAVAVGALVGVLMAGVPGRVRAAGLLAGGTAAAVGAYDDVAGTGDTKGLRGHLGAMAQGELTSGGLKVLSIGTSGLLAGATARGGRGGLIDALLAGSVVAGGANLLNLLDLRPGRAAKAALIVGGPTLLVAGPFGDLVAGPLGAVAALLPEDLAERAMLGDAGANAVGALLGVGAAAALPRGGLAAASLAVVALTLASERVSFTAVIERTPLLRAVDRLGRRPVG